MSVGKLNGKQKLVKAVTMGPSAGKTGSQSVGVKTTRKKKPAVEPLPGEGGKIKVEE